MENASFTGHETFTFRWGWLKKAFDAVSENPSFFYEDDAFTQLGVGKNMVRSIRYWSVATGLVQEDPDPNDARLKVFVPSDIGARLLSDDGWDPYIEDPATLWLLHWLLVREPSYATTWHLAFTVLRRNDFTRDELLDFLLPYVEQSTSRATESSLLRDVNCFIRTYVGSESEGLTEEALECPLVDLHLIQRLSDSGSYRFNIGSKPSLPGRMLAFTIADFATRRQTATTLLSVDDCLYRPGSPGQAFKLDPASFIGMVEQLEHDMNGRVRLSQTVGLQQVIIADDIQPLLVLAGVYE